MSGLISIIQSIQYSSETINDSELLTLVVTAEGLGMDSLRFNFHVCGGDRFGCGGTCKRNLPVLLGHNL